jgi:hypothetical protein
MKISPFESSKVVSLLRLVCVKCFKSLSQEIVALLRLNPSFLWVDRSIHPDQHSHGIVPGYRRNTAAI